MWVSPFRYLRIVGYLLLPEAFRSLSRLSSALSAKASTLRSFLLDLLLLPRLHSVVPGGLLSSFDDLLFRIVFQNNACFLFLGLMSCLVIIIDI